MFPIPVSYDAQEEAEMHQMILALRQENLKLMTLNKNQAEAFIDRNKELERINTILLRDMETLQSSSAELEGQVAH
jgi:hypothetical protein